MAPSYCANWKNKTSLDEKYSLQNRDGLEQSTILSVSRVSTSFNCDKNTHYLFGPIAQMAGTTWSIIICWDNYHKKSIEACFRGVMQ